MNQPLKKKPFTPLKFLASLGAGGIAVMPFVLFQYTVPHAKGLLTWAQIGHGSLPLHKELFFGLLEVAMIGFALLHFALTVRYLKQLISWMRSEAYRPFIQDPLKNSAILAPFVSIGMTFNVMMGVVRFFVPALSDNFQAMMFPALIAWGILWAALLRMEIKLLGISFASSFDVSRINFGWLLHPFALGMITVSGTGIAALSKSADIAHTAAFMSAITGTMGLFLLTVKTVALFKSHFSAPGLPDKQFLPSLLVVVPNITLFAISGVRLVHYAEHHLGAHLHWLGQAIVVFAFAFEAWYMAFGIHLLAGYFKNHLFHSEFHVSQWGLICPFVAFAVLGSFFHRFFAPHSATYIGIVATMIAAFAIYALLAAKNLKCAAVTKRNIGHDCSESLIPKPMST